MINGNAEYRRRKEEDSPAHTQSEESQKRLPVTRFPRRGSTPVKLTIGGAIKITSTVRLY